tara:strand:+ start:1508 stop:1795 length:288 start_codon:yes stop_codon:yes gene_type:complete
MSSNGTFEIGNVMVSTTNNKGHDPEFWAEQITNKIVSVSVNAEPHVRQQALAFRSFIYEVILAGTKSAIASDRVTIRGMLSAQGHEDMANIIKEL